MRVGHISIARRYIYPGRALDALRRNGVNIPDAFLSHLAPLGWRHINLTGDYHWASKTAFEPDGFRPLRPWPSSAVAA